MKKQIVPRKSWEVLIRINIFSKIEVKNLVNWEEKVQITNFMIKQTCAKLSKEQREEYEWKKKKGKDIY